MKTSSILKIVLLLGFTSSTAYAEDDMDHGLDWQFEQEEEEETREKQEFDIETDPIVTPEPAEPQDDDSLVPIEIDEDEEEASWRIYVDYFWTYEHEIYEAFINILHKIDEKMISREHKSIDNHRQAVFYGLQDGLFKDQSRAHSTCLIDGEQYFWGLYDFMLKFFYEHADFNSQEIFALEDLITGFVQKCTIQDSVQGTLVLNALIFGIDMLPDEYGQKLSRRRVQLRMLDLWGFMSGISELAYFLNILLYKFDGFTSGKFFGKIIKSGFQFYIMRYTSNQYYLYDFAEDGADAVAESTMVEF